jgi:hypothetical protein
MMKMKFFSAFVCVLFLNLPMSAQHYEIPRYQLSLSFFGELLSHPGVRLGFTTPIAQRIKEKDNSKIINKGWVVGGYLTYYKHPRNHKGLMLTGSIGRQRIGNSGFQSSLNLEAGYMLSILDGEVFEWDGEKIVEGNKGSSHLVFGLNGGIGWNFDKKTSLPVSFMIQPHLYFQAPYNTFIAPRVALDTKLSYYLK